MAGISGRMDRAAYRAALCAQPRVPARVSDGGVRFFGRMPARFATGTERNVPGASVSRSVAGGRTVRVSAHGAAAAAGATLSGAVRERNAARTGGETPLNVLRLRGLSHFLRAPQGGLTRADGGDGAAVSARPAAETTGKNGADPAVSGTHAGRSLFCAPVLRPENAGGGGLPQRKTELMAGCARQRRKRA